MVEEIKLSTADRELNLKKDNDIVETCNHSYQVAMLDGERKCMDCGEILTK